MGLRRVEGNKKASLEEFATSGNTSWFSPEKDIMSATAESFPTTELGEYYAQAGTWGEVFKSPEVREALGAAIRTLINAGITAGEFVPVIGELVSWGADAGKTLHRVMTAFGLGKYNFSNTSPDVPMSIAIGSEFADVATGTLAPSHAIETGWQLKADLPRIKKGIHTARAIRQHGYDSYLANRTAVDDAIDTFLE